MRRCALALATVLATLGPAVAARAVTTVGSDLSRTPTASPCATSCTAFTVAGASGTPVAVVPFDGVVVRWRVRAGTAASAVALRALRITSSGTYAGIGASDPQTLPKSSVSTFATRLPVKAGDILGADSAGAQILAASTATDVQVFNPQLGGSPSKPNTTQTGRELLVNADVEPDADGDGYGDETQDLCPTDPTRHTACLSNLSVSARPEPAPLTVGRPLTFTVKVANAGPSAAQDVGLVLNLPFTATPLQVRAGRGYCAGAFTVTCHLGAIAANDSGTVLLTVRPEVPGTLLMTAQTSTTTDETSTDDNGFTSDVTVLPPTLRLLDMRLTHPAIAVGGRTAIRWYMTDAAAVRVAVQQISRRGHIRTVGAFAVAGRPGPNSVAFHGRVPRRRPLKPGTYRFTVTAATPDGRVAAPQQLGFVVRHRRR